MIIYSGIYGENGSFFDTTGSSITETVHSYSRGKNVTDEVIPDSVIAIGKCTFYGQTELTSITFPETVNTIGRDAFRGCTGLTELRLPSSLVSLGSGAFADCTGLVRVELNGGQIAGGAFTGCVNLQTFQIAPDCSLWAEGAALLDTSRDMPTLLCAPTATGEYLVPEGVGKLAARAFEGCKGLKRVVLPDSVTAIGENAFAECFDLEEVVLPAGLKSIAKETFDSCHKLRQVNLPESVKKIGDRAFAGCESLEVLALPPKLGEIGENAFDGCCRMTLASSIQGSLKKLGTRAFAGCESLTVLVIGAKKTVELGSGVFARCKKLQEVRVLSQEAKIHAKSCEDWEGALVMPYIAIGELPAACKEHAVLGFVRLDLEMRSAKPQAAKKSKKPETSETLREDYCKYIKAQKKKLYPAAVEHEELLQLMFTEKMIPQKDIDLLLEECEKQKNTTAKVVVLEYAHQNFKPANTDKNYKL